MSSKLKDKILILNYAKSYINLVTNTDQNNAREDVVKVKNLLDYSEKEINYFKFLRRKAQILFIEQIFTKINSSKILYNLCLVIAINKRLFLLHKVLEYILDMFNHQQNQLNATITSSISFKESEISEISNILSNLYNKKFIITNKIDPKILAGIIVKVNSSIFDDSLLGKLNKIQNFG